MSKGLARQSRLILDNIGIAFRSQTANEWFNLEHSLSKLDSEQKKEAWRQYAIKLITGKAAALEMNEKQARRDQLSAHIESMKTKFGEKLE